VGTTGKLLAAAGVCGAVVIGVSTFMYLRPDSPEANRISAPTTSTTTTTTTPPPVALPPPPPEGPILRGTYSATVSFRTATVHQVVSISSDCARCDVTVTADGHTGTATWNGTGWERTTSNGACSIRSAYIPVEVVDGIVQTFNVDGEVFPGCGTTGPATGSATRTGD
jgi:hypothetical protein